MIHFGDHLRFLVPQEFETKVRRVASYLAQRDAPASETANEKFFLDLSRVEWVELGCLVQFVLLVEAALKAQISVTVALPLPRARKSEERWMHTTTIRGAAEQTRDRIDRRVAAFGFLDYLQFRKALSATHLNMRSDLLTILDDYDSSTREESEGESEGAHVDDSSVHVGQPQREYLYKYFFPLTWVSRQQTENLTEMARFLAAVIGEPKRGLRGLDAQTIANVILYELIDNVSRHSETASVALVAAWAAPESSQLRYDNYLSCERPYVQWMNQLSTSYVEVVVGDSGVGLARSLSTSYEAARSRGESVPKSAEAESANIILWAFDRWSSSKDRSTLRGTRGLYRVDRVVKKYQGFVAVRTDDQFVGLDHGGLSYDATVWADDKLVRVPGTVVRLRVPAFHQSLPPMRAGASTSCAAIFRIVSLGPIASEGLTEEAKEKLRRALTSGQPTESLCVIAVIHGGNDQRDAIEAVLRQAAEIRHPSALILCGLPGGWQLIENAIDSINQESERRRLDQESSSAEQFEVWDPVLILGQGGNYSWAGATGDHASVLFRLVAEGGILSAQRLEDLVPDVRRRASVLLQLRNDTHLVRLRDDSGVELSFTLDAISQHVGRLLEERVNSLVAGEPPGCLYRTPSLMLVKSWLDVRRIVDETCGTELACLALSIRVRQSPWWVSGGGADAMLSDSTVHSRHTEMLGHHLDVRRMETILGEAGSVVAPGVHILSEDSNVVVFSDIVASGESVRRCIRQILRDGARPLAVVCLLDEREQKTGEIELWGIKVPVVALAQVDILADKEGMHIENISPITRQIEAPRDFKDQLVYKIGSDTLLDLVKKHHALHFSHIGRPIGRHFTFYLDATGLVEETEVRDAFHLVIDEWIGHTKSFNPTTPEDKVELWHPEPEPKASAPARRLAEWIQGERNDITTSRIIRREPAYGRWAFSAALGQQLKQPNVVIIDWGAVTGTTAMQMIRLAAAAGAKRVLACVFLSQLPIDEEAFLRILHTLRVSRYEKNDSGQTQPLLPTFGEEGSTLLVSDAVVSIELLARFPIAAYSPHECPVCQQLLRLSQEVYPTRLLEKFATRQEEDRLRLRKSEQVLNTSPVDFDGQLLSDEAVTWMAIYRESLVDALSSTRKRRELFRALEVLAELFDSSNCVNKQINEACWLLRFLSVESHWLRMPPFHFQAFRDIVAKIALQVAVNDQIPESDRLNAIIVLRTSSKFAFARQIASLFPKVQDSPRLVEQLLYDIFTYASRPYHQMPTVLEPLKEGLKLIRSRVASHQIVVTESVADTIDKLESRVQRGHAEAGIRVLSPIEAWRSLQREFDVWYNKKHNTIADNIALMQPAKIEADKIEEAIRKAERGSKCEGLLDPGVRAWLTQLNDYWSTCRTFLDNTLLPHLGRIRELLDCQDGRLVVGADTVSRLLELCDVTSPPWAESEFSMIVASMSKEPSAVLSRRHWEQYKRTSGWLWANVLRGGQRFHSSGLIEYIRSAPTEAGVIFNTICGELQRGDMPYLEVAGSAELTAENPKVFCATGLLRDVFRQILSNIHKHRLPGASPEARVQLTQGSDSFSLSIRNNLSQLSDQSGEGLSELRDRLLPFSSEITPVRQPNDGWSTFAVDIRFPKGW